MQALLCAYFKCCPVQSVWLLTPAPPIWQFMTETHGTMGPPMKLRSTLLMATFSLIMSALSAQAANITIPSLPFTVSVPGTYVLAANMTFTSQQNGNAQGAISIPANLPGPVIVDLKGFTITGNGGTSVGVTIGGAFTGPQVSNAFPITVRNGNLKNLDVGVWAETAQGTFLKDIEINHLTVSCTVPAPNGITVCVDFGDYINSSTVKNCTFSDAVYGIRDILSNGGNRYTNVTFDITVDIRLELGPNGNDLSTVILDDCRFEPPAN